MKPSISIRKALADKKLLGNVFAGSSWRLWRTLLIAAMGEALNDEERETFTRITGREREPLMRVEELVVIAGRRGGKSRSMAVLACYLAALCRHNLVAGETGIVLLIAPDQRQAKIALGYATAALEQSPILRQLISNRTNDTLELNNGISIEVRSASFRRLRGPTYIAVIADEAGFWYGDEISANADTEILASVRPGLSTTGGPLIIASSPYAKRGVLWQAHKQHYGKDGDRLILVAQGESRIFNPSLPQSVVDRALERDRAAATSDYLAQFRTDLETFVPFEIVQSCIGDYHEMAPISDQMYHAFVDPSGGSSNSFTLAISHRDGQRNIIDATREVRPPFSPEQVIDDFANLLKTYRIFRVVGDRYAGEFPRELFRNRGIQYVCSQKYKSDLYRDLLPMLNSGSIVLPRNDRLVNQLTNLERRVSRAGKDSISHPDGDSYHDDLANCVAGAADCVNQPTQEQASCATYTSWFYADDEPSEIKKRLMAQGASPPCLIDFSNPKNQFHGTWKAVGFEDQFEDEDK